MNLKKQTIRSVAGTLTLASGWCASATAAEESDLASVSPPSAYGAKAAMSMTGFAPISSALATPAHSDNRFSFVVIADTQAGSETRTVPAVHGIDAVTPQIIADAAARNPLFTVFPGDLVGSGNVSGEWAKWLTATASLGDNRYIVPGNHDFHPTRGKGMKTWQQVFTNPTTGLPWIKDRKSVV